MIISLDTETTGLDLHREASPFLINTLSEEEEKRSWEFEVDPFTRKVIVEWEKTRDLADYICQKSIVFHHADFDLRALARVGIRIYNSSLDWIVPSNPGPEVGFESVINIKQVHDTQLLSHVVNSQGTADFKSESGRHALKPLAAYYLDIPEDDEGELRKATVAARRIGKRLGWKNHEEVAGDYWMPRAALLHYLNNEELFHETPDDDPIFGWGDLCAKYCHQDCYRTLALFFFLQEELRTQKLEANYERELRLLPVTHCMENFGMYCPKDRIEEVYTSLDNQAADYKSRAESILEEESGVEGLNANSGQQLMTLLKDLKLPVCVKTKPSKAFPEGQWASDAKTVADLAQYAEHHKGYEEVGEALRLIVGWNGDYGDCDEEGNKLEKAIPGYRTFQTGAGYSRSYLVLQDALQRVHPSFNQVGTAWTRYSSSEPNGQNVSKKAVLPLRRMFGPPPGYIWYAVDYSQLELRIYAYASNDAGLIQSFQDGYDFHSFTAMSMYGLSADQINSEQRRAAKAVNFGIIFGSGAAKVDASSGQPGTYQKYMDKFPNAKKAMNDVINQVYRNGFVFTLAGYRLFVPPEKPYAAMNAVVQGTAGDIMKNAMVDIHESGLVDWAPATEELPYGGSAIVANIHDELVFQIPLCYPHAAIARRLIKTMEAAGSKLGVITPCDAKVIETNWAEGKKFAA